MTAPQPAQQPPTTRRWWTITLVIILLGVVAVAVWRIVLHLNTWQGLADARAALARGDVTAAREQLEKARDVYTDSYEIWFLLGQAYRREGNLTEARRALNEAKRLGWVKEAIDFEFILLDAQEALRPSPDEPNWRKFAEIEAFLQEARQKNHPESALICEVLVPAAVARCEGSKASLLLGAWLKLQPDSGLAWEWQGCLDELLRNRPKAIESYTKALELVPGLQPARRSLVALLLDENQLDRAAEYLDGLPEKGPDGPTLRARYLVLKGKTDEARRALIPLLDRSPRDAELLSLRGRLELEAGNASEAEKFLKESFELDGYRPDALEAYEKCLEGLGKAEEAQKVRTRLEAVKADLAQLDELVPSTMESPDPRPRQEAGEAFLRLHRYQEGLAWLQSALFVAPDHAPTHKALADFFEKVGQKDRAAFHRKMAQATKPPSGK